MAQDVAKGNNIMKIRSGVVSNSSSSSFCIIGVEMTKEPMEVIKDMLKINDEDIFAKMAEENTTETIEDFCRDWLQEVLEDKDVEAHYFDDEGTIVVGNYVGSWEYESTSCPAQAEFDAAKEIVEKLGFSADDLKIFLGTSYC